MASGGSRNRSGPQANPSSGRSDRRGYKLTALPSSGYDQSAPHFPLPERKCFFKETDGEGRQVRVFDATETKHVAEREAELWAWSWTLPQACAWSMPSESWRLQTIALWVRTFVVCEGSEATAADKGSLHRFADQIGMSPAGLKENGWAISVDEVGVKSRDAEDQKPEPKQASSRDRLKAVSRGS